MNPLNHTAIAALALTATTSNALAQGPPPDWDRQVTGVAIQSNDIGTHTIVATWRYGTQDPTLPNDLGTEIDILVNGVLLHTEETSVIMAQGPGDGPCPTPFCNNENCGYASYEGSYVELHCHQSYYNNDPAQGAFCTCSGPVCVVEIATPLELNVQDRVQVVIRPATGASPDFDTSNDSITKTYDGTDTRWRRKITGINIQETAPGSGSYDVTADLSFVTRYDGLVDASTEVELFIDGVSHGSHPTMEPYYTTFCDPMNDCGVSCITYSYYGDITGTCGWIFPSCYSCGAFPTNPPVWPDCPINPGSEVEVVVRAAPGALPALDPLPGEETDHVWRQTYQPPPCDGDANVDGVVDVNDISYVVFRLGSSCSPF